MNWNDKREINTIIKRKPNGIHYCDTHAHAHTYVLTRFRSLYLSHFGSRIFYDVYHERIWKLENEWKKWWWKICIYIKWHEYKRRNLCVSAFICNSLKTHITISRRRQRRQQRRRKEKKKWRQENTSTNSNTHIHTVGERATYSHSVLMCKEKEKRNSEMNFCWHSWKQAVRSLVLFTISLLYFAQ